MERQKLYIDKIIEEWGPKSEVRIAKIRANLDMSDRGHVEISNTLDSLEENFLVEDYIASLKALVPRDQIVFSHNDM